MPRDLRMPALLDFQPECLDDWPPALAIAANALGELLGAGTRRLPAQRFHSLAHLLIL